MSALDLAQSIPVPDAVGPIIQLGIAGFMLWWFMVRVERKLDTHTSVINDLATSITLDVLSRDNISVSTRTRADELLMRMNTRKAALRTVGQEP